jgi:hypothetical protein
VTNFLREKSSYCHVMSFRQTTDVKCKVLERKRKKEKGRNREGGEKMGGIGEIERCIYCKYSSE